MRRAVLLFAIFSAISVCQGVLITVDDDGPADFNNIQAAIDFAVYGDTIQVAVGTYIENITLKNGVALIGQDPNKTIIDGNDNAIGITSLDCDSNTILEGFTIKNGFGMGNRYGSPRVNNCTFRDNYGGRLGGGMHNDESSPIVTDCNFINNFAYNYGGGMLNEYGSPIIINCTFIGNYTFGRGGGIFNVFGNPTITDCNFINNSADEGAGMHNYFESKPNVINCTFSDNSSYHNGGGMCNDNGEPNVINCVFNGNSVDYYGGGIYNYRSNPSVTDCTFSSNSAVYFGGGIYCEESEIEVTDCVFNGNSAFGGGGMSNRYCDSIVTNCTFSSNTAFSATHESGYGGGMYNSRSNLEVTKCVFTGNSTDNIGGGMYNSRSNLEVTNCALTGNSVTGEYSWGGGVCNEGSNLMVANCTFHCNSANFGGGMVNLFGGDYIIVTNCVFRANTAILFPQIKSSDSLTITYSDIEGGWEGEGNIDADPCFAEPGYWDPNGTPGDANDDFWVDGDYHLLPDSPCIDAGTDAGVYTDIEGNIRPFDYPDVDNNGELGEFDMGAYEAMPWIEVPMKFTPQTLNCYSKGKWVKAHLVLPAEFNVEDVDSNSLAMVQPVCIEPNHTDIFVNEDSLVEIEVAFGRAYLCSALSDNWFYEVTITVKGSFTNGWYFYGKDTIKIIDNSYKYLELLSSHWLDVNCSEPDWCDGVDIDQDCIVNFIDFAIMALHQQKE